MRNREQGLVAKALRTGIPLALFFSFMLVSSPLCADSKVKTVSGDEKYYRDVISDKSVIANFIYTRCEGVCPGQGQRFMALQKLLGDRLGREVLLVSLSIDPERDSLDDLKNWGESYHAKPGWILMRADREATDALCKEMLGMTLTKAEHSPFVAIRRKGGVWERVYGFSSGRDILSKIDNTSPPTPI